MTSLSLLDWRRGIGRLYADIRDMDDVEAAHDLWKRSRDELLKHHPQSPVPESQRAAFAGARVAPYDPGMRFEAVVDTDVETMRMEVETATDGVVSFDRLGRVHLAGVGDLDVWWVAAYGG